jgi:hypothetical protein
MQKNNKFQQGLKAQEQLKLQSQIQELKLQFLTKNSNQKKLKLKKNNPKRKRYQ